MLAKREKILLLALGAVIALCAVVICIVLGSERLNAAAGKISQYEAQIGKLSGSMPSLTEITALRDQAKTELERKKARFYAPGEISLYDFGLLMKKRLVALGMSVARTEFIEDSVQFSVTGSIRSLVLFLKEVSASEKYWTLSSLTLRMREGTETVDAVFRMGYEVIDNAAG
jgi:hypothetical protein